MNAMYVDGEYWLTLLPPEGMDPADGPLYDLELCFCSFKDKCAGSVTSPRSVLFQDQTLREVLTVDRSYSMHFPEPAETSKIVAAKNAARLYVDSAQDDDELGLVLFSGNNAECDDDAFLGARSGGIVPLASGRGLLRDDVNDIFEDGWTSIGDGIKKARDLLLDASGSPADRLGIVLMSDGLENEADFWDGTSTLCGTPPVRDSFDATLGGPAANVRIDTLAFGGDADQPLLAAIADFSQGLAIPVSSDAPAPSGVGSASSGLGSASSALTAAPAASELEVPNRLASAYRTIEDDTRGLDRLFFAAAPLEAGVPLQLEIPVTEAEGGGVAGAVLAFNWHRESAGVRAELTDPSGVRITPATPGWTIASSATNVTFQFRGILPPGEWRVQLVASEPVQALALLSGRIVHGVNLDTRLSQVRGGGPHVKCELLRYQYLRGLPVTVLANLSDRAGGVTGARVEARVTSPNGEVNRLSLYDDGAHDDALPGDGIYGNVYTRTRTSAAAGGAIFPRALRRAAGAATWSRSTRTAARTWPRTSAATSSAASTCTSSMQRTSASLTPTATGCPIAGSCSTA